MAELIPFQGAGERYLTRDELKDKLGIGMTKLDDLVKAGMPSHTWGMRVRRFLWSEVSRWLAERDRMAAMKVTEAA